MADGSQWVPLPLYGSQRVSLLPLFLIDCLSVSIWHGLSQPDASVLDFESGGNDTKTQQIEKVFIIVVGVVKVWGWQSIKGPTVAVPLVARIKLLQTQRCSKHKSFKKNYDWPEFLFWAPIWPCNRNLCHFIGFGHHLTPKLILHSNTLAQLLGIRWEMCLMFGRHHIDTLFIPAGCSDIFPASFSSDKSSPGDLYSLLAAF